ncbi:MAG: kynureninase [Bacteroidetes bacterium]|nr:kynureninase [Bacteroidota bacterium]MBS1972717.1 kynureninase [Bacteroidota bacterium]
MSNQFHATLGFARQKDEADPLSKFRNEFYFPQYNGKNAIYFCGNSLGLQPKLVKGAIEQELTDWQELAVGGYLHAKNPWLYYQHNFNKPLSKILGCLEHEVTVMNTLTVNLHLMMLSFYHPTRERYKILMEAGAFPSDQYAVETQVKFHGLDPGEAIIEISPRQGEKIIREEDIIESIKKNKNSLSLVLIGGINYYSGQFFDLKMITEAAHKAGAIAGFDLAHVAGNVPIQLHDWDADFAVWCSYKYLNGGPGAVGGVYVHERYSKNINQARLAGWWGNDEAARFKMEKGFIAKPDASGWNISTAQVFNMVALKASLELFQQTTIESLSAKSKMLTGYLEFLLQQLSNINFEIITPKEPKRRGAQLSLFFKEKGKEIHQEMAGAGIIVDYREPGAIRVAPAPMYNSFEDVFRFYEILKNFNE